MFDCILKKVFTESIILMSEINLESSDFQNFLSWIHQSKGRICSESYWLVTTFQRVFVPENTILVLLKNENN